MSKFSSYCKDYEKLAREDSEFHAKQDAWLNTQLRLAAILHNLASSLAVAGALASERAKGYNEGWGDGWDAAERYFGVR